MKHLTLQHPIIQAPMNGGITTPKLVSTVSNCGCLGSYAGSSAKIDSFVKDIKNIQAQTSRPFAVNLFVPQHYYIDPKNVQTAIKALEPVFRHFDLTPQLPSNNPLKDEQKFLEKIDTIIKLQVPVCSFTFGIPKPEVIRLLKENGVFIIGTATCLAEAIAVEQAGCDAVVAQGIEAGGHRGGFIHPLQEIALDDLILALKKSISIPIIASGGIMTRKDILHVQALGVSTVQMGTSFLLTHESGANETYKDYILNNSKDNTLITKAFTGKPARSIRNNLTDILHRATQNAILPYPLQNSLTRSIRDSSKKADLTNYQSLWCGVRGYMGKRQSVAELVNSLV